MARTQDNKVIDLDCISINVDGLTNNASHVRCENNKDTEDGFVYTCSTTKNEEGQYEYNYSFTKDNGTTVDIIRGADADDLYRASNAIRNKEGSESIINAQNVWDAFSQFNGQITSKEKFVYNEGYSANLGNSKADENATSLNGAQEFKVTNIYDENTTAFSDQLTAIRGLIAE